jgi:uncharacterized protein (DUF1697 family)
MKYIALLRGINVGGNNKVAMAELRACLTELGFSNVITYINSGNVIFEAPDTPLADLVILCEQAIEKQFGFFVRLFIITAAELIDAVNSAPGWWNDGSDSKHNAIFVIPPASANEVIKQAGEIKPEYEKLDSYGNVIFWSAPTETFGRTRYAKIVGSAAYKNITIRNANTCHKLLELAGC